MPKPNRPTYRSVVHLKRSSLCSTGFCHLPILIVILALQKVRHAIRSVVTTISGGSSLIVFRCFSVEICQARLTSVLDRTAGSRLVHHRSIATNSLPRPRIPSLRIRMTCFPTRRRQYLRPKNDRPTGRIWTLITPRRHEWKLPLRVGTEAASLRRLKRAWNRLRGLRCGFLRIAFHSMGVSGDRGSTHTQTSGFRWKVFGTFEMKIRWISQSRNWERQ